MIWLFCLFKAFRYSIPKILLGFSKASVYCFEPLKKLEIARSNILEIKDLGFRIALDDIGSGYTPFANLCEYPVEIVKIDRKILVKADQESGRKLLLGIVSFIRGLGYKVVCEGVETPEQDQLARESGCDYIQGWYYSKASPEKAAEDFAREYMKNNVV